MVVLFFVPAGSQLMDAAVARLLVVLSTFELSVENTGSQIRARDGPYSVWLLVPANGVIKPNDFLDRTMDTHFIQAVYRCLNIPLISLGPGNVLRATGTCCLDC